MTKNDDHMIPEAQAGVAEIARALIQRIAWEQEHGTLGFRPQANPAPALHESFTSAQPNPTQNLESPASPAEEHQAPPAAETSSPPRPERLVATSDEVQPISSGQRQRPQNLDELRAAIGDCTRCPLHQGRTNLVFGDGNPHARLVFVGEGPGRDEDMQGLPFVGAAGQLLDRIIAAMGLNRNDVYICNVVKCRPPNNRVPNPVEQSTCGRFLRYQLELIAPEVVVALGGTAAQHLIGVEESVGRLRGRFHEVGSLRVLPTYHPAYLLRNPADKKAVWQDMQIVQRALGMPVGDNRRTT